MAKHWDSFLSYCKAQKGHVRHERGCEMRWLCATSEAYDQNDQVPIVAPCVSRGKCIMLGCMGHVVSHIIWQSQGCSQAQ